jgi:peroxiredoxin
MDKRGFIFAGVVVVVGLAGFLLMSTTTVTPQGKVKLGTPTAGAACREVDCLPEFEATTLDGKVIRTADLRGKAVLINHWATWCKPCVKELPALESMYRQLKDQDFVVLGIADDTAPDAYLRSFAEEKGVSFPLIKNQGALERAFGRPALIPTSTLYGPDGHVKQVWTGIVTEDDLHDALGRL